MSDGNRVDEGDRADTGEGGKGCDDLINPFQVYETTWTWYTWT